VGRAKLRGEAQGKVKVNKTRAKAGADQKVKTSNPKKTRNRKKKAFQTRTRSYATNPKMEQPCCQLCGLPTVVSVRYDHCVGCESSPSIRGVLKPEKPIDSGEGVKRMPTGYRRAGIEFLPPVPPGAGQSSDDVATLAAARFTGIRPDPENLSGPILGLSRIDISGVWGSDNEGRALCDVYLTEAMDVFTNYQPGQQTAVLLKVFDGHCIAVCMEVDSMRIRVLDQKMSDPDHVRDWAIRESWAVCELKKLTDMIADSDRRQLAMETKTRRRQRREDYQSMARGEVEVESKDDGVVTGPLIGASELKSGSDVEEEGGSGDDPEPLIELEINSDEEAIKPEDTGLVLIKSAKSMVLKLQPSEFVKAPGVRGIRIAGDNVDLQKHAASQPRVGETRPSHLEKDVSPLFTSESVPDPLLVKPLILVFVGASPVPPDLYEYPHGASPAPSWFPVSGR
jgi:hypothetical protein